MFGKVLTDADGMMFYNYDENIDGVTQCMRCCSLVNPPTIVADTTEPKDEDLTIITRVSGSKQWVYKGRPLYRFLMDILPGIVNIENNRFHIAKP